MTTFSREERSKLTECCNRITENLREADTIIDSYKKEDSSFDFLFLLGRLRIGALNGPNSYLKVSRQVNVEARALLNEPISKKPGYISVNLNMPDWAAAAAPAIAFPAEPPNPFDFDEDYPAGDED